MNLSRNASQAELNLKRRKCAGRYRVSAALMIPSLVLFGVSNLLFLMGPDHFGLLGDLSQDAKLNLVLLVNVMACLNFVLFFIFFNSTINLAPIDSIQNAILLEIADHHPEVKERIEAIHRGGRELTFGDCQWANSKLLPHCKSAVV